MQAIKVMIKAEKVVVPDEARTVVFTRMFALGPLPIACEPGSEMWEHEDDRYELWTHHDRAGLSTALLIPVDDKVILKGLLDIGAEQFERAVKKSTAEVDQIHRAEILRTAAESVNQERGRIHRLPWWKRMFGDF